MVYKTTNHVVITNGIPTVLDRGHLKAELVARMVVDDGYTIEQAMEHYNLSRAQMYSIIAFYYENQDYLDAEHKHKWDLVHRDATPSAEFIATLMQKKHPITTEE
ncbi:MAG: hypothetical protein SH821_01140 [Phototrophicales bacterium]|mgnify:CR=1 FL=1|nr:hypothetical protein [Phototrophicales bacterium]